MSAPVVGILGGGQLGRMMALDAAPLGVRCHVYAPAVGPAMHVTDQVTLGAYDDVEALQAFGRACDVVTFEFENVPGHTAEALAEVTTVHPGPRAFAVCRDRIAEKSFLRDEAGVQTAPWAPMTAAGDVAAFLAARGTPVVLKTAQLGYDGKGQRIVRPGDDVDAAWDALTAGFPGVAIIAEGFVDFAWEGSVVIARSATGEVRAYELVRNTHRDHILHTTDVPAGATRGVAEAAEELARQVVDALDYVGVMGVEMFVGADGSLAVNELAPRVHNSGHWTQDGAVTSQFEQHLRAVLGWPLGDPSRRPGAWRMVNLLGDDVDTVPTWIGTAGAHVHLYGKAQARPGRKMGHVNHPVEA